MCYNNTMIVGVRPAKISQEAKGGKKMIKTKKLVAFGLAIVLSFSLVGCKKEDPKGTTKPTGNDTTEAPKTEVPTTGPNSPIAHDVEEGFYVGFENGSYSFIKLNTTKGDANAPEISVADYLGSKALKIKGELGKTYLGIDISSLLGDKVADVKTITLDMAIEREDGSFKAVSGSINAYVTNSEGKIVQESQRWSLYKESANPKTIKYEIKDTETPFVANAQNIIEISKEVDDYTDSPATMYIDNIIFLDGNGEEIAIANESAEFEGPKGYGSLDWSNGVVKPENEIDLKGMEGETNGGWWFNGGITFVEGTETPTYNADDFGPGSVMTIYSVVEEYDPDQVIFGEIPVPMSLTLQYYPVDDIDLPALPYERIKSKDAVDGKSEYNKDIARVYNMKINETYTIFQIKFDDVAEMFGGDNDWHKRFTIMGIADTGKVQKIDRVTIGKLPE